MLPITLFPNLLNTHPSTVDLGDVFNQIKTDDHLRVLTEMHRQGVGQKQKVPAFVPSAIMEGGRKTENIRQFTGLIYFDYDHLDEEQMEYMAAYLGMLMHCVGYHRSLSGKGLHVILSQALLDYEKSKPHVATGNAVGRPVKTQISRAFDAAEAFAKTQGFEPKHGTLNKFLSTVIYEVNRYGIEQDDALAEAKDRYFYYGDGERGITSVVKSIYESKQAEFGTLRLPSLQKNSEKKVHRSTSADIEAFLLSQGTYRKNQISHKLEVEWNEDSQMAQYHQRNQTVFSLADNSSLLTPNFSLHHFEKLWTQFHMSVPIGKMKNY